MLERNHPKSLYQQLHEILEDEIQSGKWKENERIPSENELSVTYGVSRMTARAVLTDLVKEGLLYRVQGKGTFVAEDAIPLSPTYTGVREQLEQMGYHVTTKIISVGAEPSNSTVAKHLNIEKGSPVFRIIRVRSIKGEPISVHISYINEKYSDKLTPDTLEREQLCALLNEHYGLQRKNITETLESVAASKEEAHLLNIEQGHPLIMLRDVIWDQAGRPYEYTKIIFRGDKIKIKLQYNL